VKRKKKKLKIILFVLLALVILVAIAIPVGLNYYRNKASLNTFEIFSEPKQLTFGKIVWHAGTINGQTVKKIGLFIPVKIKGIDEKFYMQLDMGSYTTLLDSATLNKVLKNYPDFKISISKKGREFLDNVTLELANSKLLLNAKKIPIYGEKDISKIDSTYKIGTIGYDAIFNRTLILDFKNNRFSITHKSIDSLGYSVKLIDGSVNKFPVFISAKIGDNKVRFLFDTGSSIFPVITSIGNLNSLNNAGKVDTSGYIHAWGNDYKLLRRKLSVPIKIGNDLFNNEYVYATRKDKFFNYLPNWYLFGITGNALFDGKIIIIDTRNDKFGIVE